MAAPNFSLPVLGTAPNQYATRELLETALTADMKALYDEAQTKTPRSVIDQAPDGVQINDDTGQDLVLCDEAGFVLARIGRAIELMGRESIAPDGDGLRIVDPEGFVLLDVTADRMRWMGHDLTAGGAAPALGGPDARGLLRRQPTDLLWTRAALGRAFAGTGRGSILCIGDSNTMGYAAAGTGQHRRALSYPVQLARMLGGYGATDGGVMGRAMGTSAGQSDYDPRLTIGAGWAADGVISLGGEAWVNTTTTNELLFDPGVPWDRADIWLRLSEAATVSLGVTGSLTEHTHTPGGLVKVSYAAPALAAQALRFARVSGPVQIVGWDCYTAGRGLSVIGAGRSGWRTDQYAAIAADVSAMAADLTLIQLGLNDWSQDIAPTVTEAALRTLVAACPRDVALVVPMQPGGSRARPWSAYRAMIMGVAADTGAPVIDVSARYGPHATALARGLVQDNTHPNAAGYVDTARALANLILES